IYAGVLPAMLSFYGAQRCGATTPAKSHHEACHLFNWVSSGKSGDGIAVPHGFDFGGAATVSASSGPAVDVEGGWHDAGAFIKFMGTTSFVLAVDLLAMKDHAAALSKPEAGHAYAGLREEMRWGLDWVVKMLGGSEMFHQVSGASDHDTDDRDPANDRTT